MRVLFLGVDTERSWAVASIGPASCELWWREDALGRAEAVVPESARAAVPIDDRRPCVVGLRPSPEEERRLDTSAIAELFRFQDLITPRFGQGSR